MSLNIFTISSNKIRSLLVIKILIFLIFPLLLFNNHIFAKSSNSPVIEEESTQVNCSATEITKIENFFNKMTILEANYTQFISDGTILEGKIYLSKPGKLKIENLSPKHYVILVENKKVTYHDYELNETSNIISNSAIVNLLVMEKLQLKENPAFEYCNKEGGELNVLMKNINKSGNTVSKSENSNENLNENEYAYVIVSLKESQNKDDKVELKSFSSFDREGNLLNTFELENINLKPIFSKDLFTFKDPKFFDNNNEDEGIN